MTFIKSYTIIYNKIKLYIVMRLYRAAFSVPIQFNSQLYRIYANILKSKIKNKEIRKMLIIKKVQQGTKLDLGETLTDEQLKNIEGVWNYLTQIKELNPRNAAAIMGNVWQECRFLPQRVSKTGATGWLQFLGERKDDYQKWIKTNEHHPDYGQFDYILYAIQDPEHKHDFYRNEYERIVNSMEQFKQQGDIVAYNKYNEYKNKIYGDRERKNRLYFFSELNDAFKNPKYSLDNLTRLWHDSIERSGSEEANISNRIKAANAFYNYYNSLNTHQNNFMKIPQLPSKQYNVNQSIKKGGLLEKAQQGTKLGNFLNSELGSGIINLGTQLISGISNSNNQQKKLNQWKNAYIKSRINQINGSQFDNQLQQEAQTNPDVRTSSLVTDYRRNQLVNEAKKAAEQQATDEANQYILSQQQDNSSTNWGDIIQSGLGIVGNFLGKKKSIPTINQAGLNTLKSSVNFSFTTPEFKII